MGMIILLAVCGIFLLSVILIMYFKRKETKNKKVSSKQPPTSMHKANGDYYE